MKGGFARIRAQYKVPGKRGMRVEVDGRPGKILSSTGSHFNVRFDKGRSGKCHPTWRFTYFTSEGPVRFGYE